MMHALIPTHSFHGARTIRPQTIRPRTIRRRTIRRLDNSSPDNWSPDNSSPIGNICWYNSVILPYNILINTNIIIIQGEAELTDPFNLLIIEKLRTL